MGSKRLIKKGMMWLHTIHLSPIIALTKAASLLPGKNYVFEHNANLLSLVPGIIGRDMRNAFYRHTLRKCGEDLRVGYGAFFFSPDTEVGNRVSIGAYSTIGICTIGDDVLVAANVSIHDGVKQHGSSDLNRPIAEQEGESKPVHIGNGSWIGEGAKVAASIAEKTIVGIGAVVLREMPSAAVVLGNPARVVSHRENPLSKDSGRGKAVD